MHNEYKSQYNIDMLSDIALMDTDDSIMQNNNKLNNKKNHLSIDIIGSFTNNTLEPHIGTNISDYGMYFSVICYCRMLCI